jgi:hypothetical protein
MIVKAFHFEVGIDESSFLSQLQIPNNTVDLQGTWHHDDIKEAQEIGRLFRA